MRKFIILTVVGALVVAFGGLALVPSADAQELIHFDCIDDTNPETPDRPHTDQFNVPQNNLQCLPTGESVLGNGTVHPNLEIESPAGHFVVKNRAGAPAAATFGAPNDSTVNDNCFEFLDTGRVPITSGFGGWGFGDTSACAPGTCQNTPSKVELNFLFHDTTVSQFSVRMFDWTDFNPALGTDFQVTLTAYDALDAVVDTYSYHHTSTVAHAGNLVNPGPYDCVIEDGNSCFGGGLL
jgi:hypothetical protein